MRRLLCATLAVAGPLCFSAPAADLVLPTGGKVTVEFIFSDASFSNTLSLVSPANAAVAITGCKLVPVSPLPGLQISSAKTSQRGCRAELDADASTPGIQPFPNNTVLSFRLCADNDGNGVCDNVWSSNPAQNSDSKEHVHTTALHAADYPNRIFQMNWEDEANLGDQDFNDFVSVVRVDIDSDGDGLWDDWEKFGIDTNGDGVIDIDLPGLGANPNHKDIFIEIDYMDCSLSGSDCASGDNHSHRPKDAAIDMVKQAFAHAPVTNPDGVNGINVHIDVSNAIPHQNFLNIPNLCFSAGSGIGSFDAVKADPGNFGPNNPRRFAYHYSLFTHQQAPGTTSSGCSELPGNDFQVALGGWNAGQGDLDHDGLPDANVGTVLQQAGTLMHELGHNLNLQHGGNESTHNYKPNYLSVMNYAFQVVGLPPSASIDYSQSMLATLDENNLSEPNGIGGLDTIFSCPDKTRRQTSMFAVDWNCNGVSTNTGVGSDVNGDGAQTMLTGFNDWANILYDFQNTGSFEDGDHSLSMPVVEIDLPTAKLSAVPPLQIATASPLPNGQMNQLYNFRLSVIGGVEPYRWSIVSGRLAAGLTLDPMTGVISGTPGSAPVLEYLTFGVTDSSTPMQSATAVLTLTIDPPQPLAVATGTLTSGQVGVAYNQTLVASGGVAPYTWTLAAGTLPAGLTLNPNGNITGTPLALYNARVVFQVTDGDGRTALGFIPIQVLP